MTSHHRTLGTRHPLPPHGTHILHQIIQDDLILYTHINCKDARDLDILVFSVFCVFWFLCSLLLVFWFGFFSFLGFGGFLLWGFFDFVFYFVFCSCLVLVFVVLVVVAYCTQLLSQAMYNLMMAAMAETCSC